MAKSTVIKILVIGFASYIALVFGVLTLFPDKPEDMDWQDREAYNKVHINKLQPGATRDEVLALLGSPDITEAKKVGNELLQIMFFRTQRVKADGITTQDECTPLLFENNKLIAMGAVAITSFKDI